MRLETVLNVTRGELVSSGMDSFSKIVFKSHKVLREDLFFATTTHEAKEAVENGAFGIIFEHDMEIFDDEISFIKVASLIDAKMRFLRYFIILMNLEPIKTSKISYELCEQFAKDPQLLFLSSDDLSGAIELLQTRNYIRFLCYEDMFCPQENYLAKNMPSHTIKTFYTSFFIDSKKYYVWILNLFSHELLTCLDLLIERKIAYKIQSQVHTSVANFSYINSLAQKIKNGTSERVVVFSDDERIRGRIKDMFKPEIVNSKDEIMQKQSQIYLAPYGIEQEFTKQELQEKCLF